MEPMETMQERQCGECERMLFVETDGSSEAGKESCNDDGAMLFVEPGEPGERDRAPAKEECSCGESEVMTFIERGTGNDEESEKACSESDEGMLFVEAA